MRWVSNRIVNRKPKANSLPVFNLDATDVEAWDRNVLDKAVAIATSFANGETIDVDPLQVVRKKVVSDDCSIAKDVGNNEKENDKNGSDEDNGKFLVLFEQVIGD